ncbi:MAG: lactate utilization protein, partial [Acidobacteriota bacterium]|nr:lactate utilization protein [Acidobacteriota bacterium]
MSQTIENLIAALKNNHYHPVVCVEKAENAVPLLLDWIPPDASIEGAGSASVMQIGILDRLRERGNKFSAPGAELTEKGVTRKDVLLVSSNAVTEDGQFLNIDGMGNRVAGMIYGVQKVILLIGANKIVRDVPEALERLQVIAPFHAKYLGMKTPCAETETCSNCNSPQRICNITTLISKRPPSVDFSVIIS